GGLDGRHHLGGRWKRCVCERLQHAYHLFQRYPGEVGILIPDAEGDEEIVVETRHSSAKLDAVPGEETLGRSVGQVMSCIQPYGPMQVDALAGAAIDRLMDDEKHAAIDRDALGATAE